MRLMASLTSSTEAKKTSPAGWAESGDMFDRSHELVMELAGTTAGGCIVAARGGCYVHSAAGGSLPPLKASE